MAESTGNGGGLRYSVVRYHNARTEEDINFGVLVYDPATGRCAAKWDVDGAVQRAGVVFPGFDGSIRFVLEVAAREFAHQVERHADQGDLEWLTERHKGCIRVTPPRRLDGTDPAAEARQLAGALVPPPVWTKPLDQASKELAAEGGSAAAVFALGILHAMGRPLPASEIVAASRRLSAPFDEAQLEKACNELVEGGYARRGEDGRLNPAGS